MYFNRSSTAFILIFIVLTALPTRSFWIIGHDPLVSQRLDPILSATSPSSHNHAFVGSAAILDSQKKSTHCTTSAVKADLSSYWAPHLYYYHAKNNTFSSIPMAYANTYYLNRGGPKMGADGKLTAFPKRFKVIAGNNSALQGPDPDSTKAKAVSYVCLNYKTGSTETSTLPRGPCVDGLRTQIVFPSCWDGKNLDSPDHQSHMAYPVGGAPDTGDCPSSHPVKVMTLFYEFVYKTASLKRSSSGKSRFVLSNGDTIGHSFHADFVSGWTVKTLQAAADQCTGNLFQDLKSCPPFVATLDYSSTCKTKQSLRENVLGNLKHLPGCQAIKNGPAKGAGAKKCKVPKLTIKAEQGGPDDATFPNRRAVEGAIHRREGSSKATHRRTHRDIANLMSA